MQRHRPAGLLARRAAIWSVPVLAALLTFAHLVRADDEHLPIQLVAQLFAKVLTYDRNFPDRAGSKALVLLVIKPGNAESARVAAQMQSAMKAMEHIGGIPHEELLVPYEGAKALVDLCHARRPVAAFFGPGFDDDVEAIRAALDGQDILTAGSVPEYVPHGIVLGFDIVSGSPKVLVHLTQAKRQHVSLRAELLHLARVFE